MANCPQLKELVRELHVSERTLRAWLRRQFPRLPAEQGTEWRLVGTMVAAARDHWRSSPGSPKSGPGTGTGVTHERKDTDEAYVIDLCDRIMGETARRQHRFDWLVGDPGRNGKRRSLPVDAYYPRHQLVVEFHERQHYALVSFFDKRHTVSKMTRAAQRRRYDRRRARLVPRHGLRYLVIRASQLEPHGHGHLKRNPPLDTDVLRRLFGAAIHETPNSAPHATRKRREAARKTRPVATHE